VKFEEEGVDFETLRREGGSEEEGREMVKLQENTGETSLELGERRGRYIHDDSSTLDLPKEVRWARPSCHLRTRRSEVDLVPKPSNPPFPTSCSPTFEPQPPLSAPPSLKPSPRPSSCCPISKQGRRRASSRGLQEPVLVEPPFAYFDTDNGGSR